MTIKDTDAIRDDIVKSIQTVSKGYAITHDGYIKDYYRGYIDGLNRATEIIDNAPTVEPERPQGKWSFDSEFLMIGSPYGSYKCSNCGIHTDDKEDNFCWNCGADMRGKNEK